MLDLHCAHLTLSGHRPATVRARRYALLNFDRSLPPRTLGTATRADVERWLARPVAAATRRSYASHLRSFYRWAVLEGHLSADPTERLPHFRVPRGQPRPVSQADIRLALAAADGRMRAWLLLMSMGGLRAMEVAGLRPCDLTVTDGQAELWLRECKGGGVGSVPAHPVLVGALTALPVRHGLWWDCSPSWVSREVGAHMHRVGVDATGHQLRHAAGTEWYRASGHDLLATARLLRHASVATTQVYAQVDPDRPRQVVRAMRTA